MKPPTGLRLALVLLVASCTVGCHEPTIPEGIIFDTDADDAEVLEELSRRTNLAPPRQERFTASAKSEEDIEAPCGLDEARWARVECSAFAIDSSPTWNGNENRWVCIRCYVDVCGRPAEGGDLPWMAQYRTCSARRVAAVVDGGAR